VPSTLCSAHPLPYPSLYDPKPLWGLEACLNRPQIAQITSRRVSYVPAGRRIACGLPHFACLLPRLTASRYLVVAQPDCCCLANKDQAPQAKYNNLLYTLHWIQTLVKQIVFQRIASATVVARYSVISQTERLTQPFNHVRTTRWRRPRSRWFSR
jgi:hypothetical protein